MSDTFGGDGMIYRTDKELGVYILRLQRLAVEARRVAERLACLHEFDPECARCEWMTPFRKALGEI